MAAPVVADVVEGGLTSAGTNLAVTLPAGGSASDEYIVIIAKGSVACTINALTGWTELLDENLAAGLAIIRYTGAGVPTNPTFVQSTSSRSVWCAYRITGANKSIAPEIGTTATGTNTTPNPPSRAVTGGPKDILSIACFAAAGEVADDDSLVTTFPTNYTSGQVEKSAGVAGSNLAGILGAAARSVVSVSSEDPGTFTQNASRAWRAQTIVIHQILPKQTSVGRVSLDSGSEPETRTDHKIKVLAKISGGSGVLRAALYERGYAPINGNFETDVSGWAQDAFVSTTFVRSTSWSRRGSASVNLSHNDATPGRMNGWRTPTGLASIIPVVAGQQVTVRGSINIITPANGAHFALYWYDVSGINLGSTSTSPMYTTDQTDLVWSVTAPVNAVFASLRLGGQSNGPFEAYFDDISVQTSVGVVNISGDLSTSSLSGSFVEYTLPITNEKADTIKSYSNLEIRWWGYSDAGDAATFDVDKLWLEIPPVAPAPTVSITQFFSFI